MNLSIAFTEEGNYGRAYETLKDGFLLKIKEDSNLDPYNDYQLHFIYLLHKLVEYDTSTEAKDIKTIYKTYLKNVKDEESKLVIANNKVAEDRFLVASAAYKQLAEIKLAKTSSHEITIKLNKTVQLLKQKKLEEAKKELSELVHQCGNEENIRDERFFLLKAYILQT